MKRKFTFLIAAAVMLLTMMATTGTMWGQTTYKLQQVTSVEAGGLYVFEQDGYVMNNAVSSSALQTTNSYQTSGLNGTETYVWTLETASNGFYMKNVYLTSNQYINNASSTGMSFGNKSSIWAFNFQTDNTVLIQNNSNSDRFLGYTNATSHAYKAYATSNISSYPHAIKVYQLVEETGTLTCATPVFSPVAGTYYEAQSVTITSATDGATIYYTLNGNDPTTSSSVYSSAISITETTTVKAMAVKADYNNSEIASATYTINEPSGETWSLVTSASDLTSGGTYVIACNTQNMVAGDISNSVMQNKSATFSTDKSHITMLSDDAVRLTLGLDGSNYTFANSSNKLLGCTAVKKLAWDSGTTTWSISFANNKMTMSSTGDGYGDMKYNSSSPRFTTYASGQTDIQLYRLEGGTITYSVTYNGNGNTGGTVPTDGTAYESDDVVTVLGNTGNLVKAGYIWAGWNTLASGEGTTYLANETFNISANTTLYAKWDAKTITNLTCTGTPTAQQYAGHSFDPTGLTVTATFNDASSENVTASVTWTPNPLTIETTSITGTYMGMTVVVEGITVTYAPGSQENPYTVAQALENTPASGTTDWIYVHGIVSAIVEPYNSQYGNISYNISDDGENTTVLYAYRGKSFNGEKFTSENDVLVGDVVTIYGKLKTYQGTKELDAGNYLIEQTHPAVTVEAPTFSVAAGGYAETQTVAITCATEGAQIYYTTDGSTPDNTKTAYTEAITVSQSQTIKAIAYVGENTSAVSSAAYYILSNDNTYTVTQALEFESYPQNNIFVEGIVSTAPTAEPNNGQLKYYISVDGENTNELYVYNGKGLNNAAFTAQDDIQVGDVVTIFGNVVVYGTNSPVIEFATGNYLITFERIETVATPTFSPAEGEYNEAQNVTIACATEGATTYYKTAGNEEWAVYSEAINVAETTTIWAYAAKEGMNNSAVATATYTINIPILTASITVDPALVEATAEGGAGTLTVTYENITISEATDFGIQFYDSEENELNGDDEPNWLIVVVESSQTSGYVVSYTIDENTGDARTAYFKVFAMNGEEFVYSNLVTINQAAYVEPSQEVVDVLDNSFTGITGTTYTGWTNTGTSNAVYVGFSAGQNSTIQLRTKNSNEGIITTTSGGKVTKVDVTWNTSTSSGRKLDIYGKNTAYSEVSDLYNNEKQGTKLGTIEYDDNEPLIISGDYEFIGIRSNDGALYLDEIQITWSTGPAAPSITVAPAEINIDANENIEELGVTVANISSINVEDFNVDYCNSDGTEIEGDKPDIIDEYVFTANQQDEGYTLTITFKANTGDARTAYFNVIYASGENDNVHSNVITVNQEAYVAPVAAITVAPDVVNDVPAAGNDNQVHTVTLANMSISSTDDFEFVYCDAEGNILGNEDPKPNWIELAGAEYESTGENTYSMVYIIAENTETTPRTGYFKIGAEPAAGKTVVYSNIVTISQEAAPTYTVTYVANGGIGTMTDPDSPYTENTQVTLLENTFTAPEGKLWDSWLVKDADQTTIAVNNNTFTMPASNVTVTAQWVDDPYAPTYEWVLTALEDLTSSDVFVIVGTRTDETYAGNYAMSNNNGNNNPPTASAITIANNKLSAAPADNLKWNISGNATDGYTFYPNGSTTTWLYCTNDNNGVRVGTNNNKTFKIEDGYLKNDATSRFVGVYQNKDWRCYTSHTGTSNNIKDQTFSYFKRQEASTDPQLSANDVNIASDATEGEITYTLENAVPGGQLSAEITAGNEGNWLTLGNVGETTVSFTCEDNTEQTERTATVTLTYTYNETSISATAVVTQAALIIDYATMPFAFDGGRADIENVNGLTQEGLDSDYGSSPKLKFNTTGDWMVLKLNAKPVSIIYDIKGNTFSGGTFNVQVSTDGITYNNIKEYTSLSDVQTDTLINANDDVRYIKWIYTAKSSGNVALGNIQVYDVEFTIINENTTIPDLTIADGEAYVVNSGVVLELTGTVTNTNPANLIVRDGGQLIHTNPDGVNATLQKVVEAYTPANRSGDGWYMIATPVDNLPKTAVASTSDFDLFLYNEPNAMWYAHWDDPGFETLYRGKGYLYANAADVDLYYAGLMKATDAEFSVPLSYKCDAYPDMKGFNLVGNPFTRNLKLGDMKLGEATLTQFYVVNPEHTGLVTIDNIDYEIKPGEGFFVQAKDENQTLEFNPSTKGLEDIRFIKIVAGNENGYDNAYINIGCGNTLRKTNIANLTSVYVMDQGLDYAATRVEELAGNMPVHFAPSEDGFFTITVEAKNIENINFMHLIDNIENTAINLLAEPTYTFKAGTSDNEDRFTLVFDFNNYLGVNENNLNDSFVYQSGDELILNGEGTLQVFDMMGRFVMSKEISGSERISTSTFETGVYVLRFVGETVMTQKIVIE